MRRRTREAKGKEDVRTPGMLARAGKTVARGLAVLGTVGIMGCGVAQRAPLPKSRNLNVMRDSRQGDEMPQVMKKGKLVATVNANTLDTLKNILNYSWNIPNIRTPGGSLVGTLTKVGASYEIRAIDAIFKRSLEKLLVAKPLATTSNNTLTTLSQMLGRYSWNLTGNKFMSVTTPGGSVVATVTKVGASFEIRAIDANFKKRLQAELRKIRVKSSTPRRRR